MFFTKKEPFVIDHKTKYQPMLKTNKLFPYVYENKNNLFNRSTIKNNKVKRSVDENYFESRKNQNKNNFKFVITAAPLMFPHKEKKIHRRDSSVENKFISKEVLGDLMNFVDDFELDFNQEKENKQLVKNILNEMTTEINCGTTNEDLFLTKMQNPVIKNFSSKYLFSKLNNKTEVNTIASGFITSPHENYTKTGDLKIIDEKPEQKFNTQSTHLKRKYISPTPQLENDYNKFKDKTKDKKYFINNISSFEVKVNRELGKVIKGYGTNENHIKFSQNPLVSKIYTKIPNFEVYKTMKLSESRPTHRYKFKLAPLRDGRVQKFNRLSSNMYYYTDRHF